MDWKELGATTWGAAQASISVLLILGYGYGASAYKLLDKQGMKEISRITTTVFLPALIFTEIGPKATVSSLTEDWPIVIFALLSLAVSYLYASLGRRMFRSTFPFPRWVVPSCMYNNVITLPLLMIESLADAGALDGIITDPKHMPDALKRAKNYFLVNALVSNLTKFSIAPRMMSSSTTFGAAAQQAGATHPSCSPDNRAGHEGERTPLIPVFPSPPSTLRRLQKRAKEALNPPLVGGVLAILVGLTPGLHGVLLAKDGALSGSLMQSIEKMGSVYAAVQIFVVGSQLHAGNKITRRKRLPKFAMFYLLAFRFVFMPTISILSIYSIRRWKPDLLLKDPIFDFALIIAPVGPPGVSIAAVANLANLSDEDNGAVARMLSLSYVVTPFISIPIAAALTLVKRQSSLYIPH